MKKYIIMLIIIGLILFCRNRIYPTRKAYLKYLETRYNEEFIIDEEITDYSTIDTKQLLSGIYDKEIDESYFKAYRIHLKGDSNKYYIVGYGKFKCEVWEPFKTKIFVDNYNK